MRKNTTIIDILKFEASNKKKDKELQKLWKKANDDFCKMIDEFLRKDKKYESNY